MYGRENYVEFLFRVRRKATSRDLLPERKKRKMHACQPSSGRINPSRGTAPTGDCIYYSAIGGLNTANSGARLRIY